jgi:hypothetical protein
MLRILARGAILVGGAFTLIFALTRSLVEDRAPDFPEAAIVGVPAGVMTILAFRWCLGRILKAHDMTSQHTLTRESDSP